MRGLSRSPPSSSAPSPTDSIDSIQDIEIGVLNSETNDKSAEENDGLPLALPYISPVTNLPRVIQPEESTFDDSKSYSSSLEKSIQAGFEGVISSVRRVKSVSTIESYLRGPPNLIKMESIKPWFPKIETFFDKLFAPIYRRSYPLPLFLLAWFLAFLFFVRASYFTSSTSSGQAVQFIGPTDSFWLKNDGCGIDGVGCMPFSNSSLAFRCPAQSTAVQLLNYYNIGSDEIIFKPLVVGGFDSLSTYRADSWICAAAVQQRIVTNQYGGCGFLQQTGTFENYIGGSSNDVSSSNYIGTFPSSYRFDGTVSQSNCKDFRNDILAFSVAMSFLFSFIFRAGPRIFFWTLLVLGFWTIVLVTDARSFPPDISNGFKFFLPTLLTGYVIYKVAFAPILSCFERITSEKTVLYLAGYWMGVLLNVSLSWIPVDQLTPASINRRPGGLIAVLVISAVIFLIVLNQIRVIRRYGKLLQYLKWYALGGIIMGVLCAIPGLQFRFHHYIAALVLLPGTAFPTRPSAAIQSFCLGMFLNGVGRWGFDTILATPASLIGDGTLGSDLPSFLTSSTNFTSAQTDLFWNQIPSTLANQWNGFSLIVDDVLVFTGAATSYNISSLASDIPHFFRLAYTLGGNSGDFTKAAQITNGQFIDALAGAGG